MSKAVSFAIIFLCINFSDAYAGKYNFAINQIPDSLLNKANSVIRLSEISLKVSSANKAKYHFHKVVTVLNDAGAGELGISFYYDQFRKLNSFKASLYDKVGNLMNKRGESDLNDYAMHDGFSLFRDARFKQLQTSGGVYPVTIDYTYTIDYSGMLDYPDWDIQKANQAVETSTYSIEMPTQIPLKYEGLNIALAPSITTHKGITEYIWAVQGIKAVNLPVSSYSHEYFLPSIDVTPETFEIAGYKGSWASWKTFGDAMNAMWKDTRNLSSETIHEVQKLVKGTHTDREKAAILYSYLQHNYRYVSVQIGVGGYIPFTASTVHATGYGDCKALSNYMCALLSAVGIKSFPALINAGQDEHPIDTSFPTDKFNHAILYAELSDGPLWLECTSNSIPFGELGVFTENRYALILSDEGGKILRTPSANANLNTLNLKSEVKVDSNFHAIVSSHVKLSGEFRQDAKQHFVLGTEKERSYYVFNRLGLKQSEIYSFENILDSASEILFQLTSTAEKIYDFKTAGKTFLPSSYIKLWYENISVDTTLQSDLVLDFPSVRREQLRYDLAGLNLNSLPADFAFSNDLVEFKRKCERLPNDQVNISTDLSIRKNIIRASDVVLLKESLQIVNKHLQQKLIINSR